MALVQKPTDLSPEDTTGSDMKAGNLAAAIDNTTVWHYGVTEDCTVHVSSS